MMVQKQEKNNLPISKIREKLNEIIPQLIEFRRVLHREPELAWQEFATTEKIINYLSNHEISRIRRPLPTGLVVDIRNGKSSNFIGLRADIDALAIPDQKKVNYASEHAGISHACGHDVHTVVMTGVAVMLRKFKSLLPLNVRIIFQPAEEPIPSGAPKMISHGVLSNLETIWAMHVEPALPLGTVCLTKGWVNRQTIGLNWKITGKGGHSARPEQTINPIQACSSLINEIDDYFNNISKEDAVFAFTTMESKSAFNAIPDQAESGATLRITDMNKKEEYLKKVVGIAGAPPVINDTKVINKLMATLDSSPGENIRIEENYRSMGGDDFGWYVQKLPGALIRFGTGGKDETPGLHTGLFDVPHEIIPAAIEFFLFQIFNWQ
ncbi:MAG: M20 family metallopeptidase [Calditrichota bacterium]